MNDDEPGMVEESIASEASVAEADDNLRNMGVAIALCGILILFGGTTFAIWSVATEASSDYGDYNTSMKFGVQEAEIEFEGDGESDSETEDYDDAGDIEDFFNNLKIMLYVLVICGAALAYMGHSGEKMEFAPKVIAGAALVSVVILLYTFVVLPDAFEEETEFFEAADSDAGFYVNDDSDSDGVEITVKAMPSIGYFTAIVSLGLAGYLIKDRGITIEDLTG